MIKNRRGDGAGPPYPDADDSPTPERPGSKYITPLSLSLWPHPIQNRDPASREGWQCEEGQKYLYLWLTVQGAGGIHCQNPQKMVTFVKVSWSIKSHDQQFMKWRSTVMLHIWNTHRYWAWIWTILGSWNVSRWHNCNHKCKWSKLSKFCQRQSIYHVHDQIYS